ncbi:MAG: hypothetical protein KIT11_03060 [Fimbriimonadaceae bacterium]|nr:hypothetical protein [Fimbriimonadaceae bacterium]QYK57123.1 MAG: hypothetical protein KF733_06465 [Fimbriimonadaceae bacterium]
MFVPCCLLLLAQVQPLPRAFSHNDYWRKQPLADALALGFCGVEADVFLQDGELLVGHNLSELKKGKTLQAMYLDPLLERVRQNGGRVYPGGPEFLLLVDVKQSGTAVWDRLKELLAERREMLATKAPGAVRVVVSGDRDSRILKDPDALAGYDGRKEDLASDLPAYRIPLVSEDWTSLFRWKGIDTMPSDEQDQLAEFVRRAHARGRKVRFWAIPHGKSVYATLVGADVDFLNVDRLGELADFLRARDSGGSSGTERER